MQFFPTFLKKLRDEFFRPVDAASLVAFRVGFGLIMLCEVWRYWRHGWIERYYIQPEFFFKYYGLGWVQPWGGAGMYVHFAVLGLLAFLISIGFFYRFAMILFTLGFGYIFLLDQTRYLNHFYLVILVALLLCALPANRSFSVDAFLRPSLRSATVPAWSVWSLRLQFEILYLFAGIVKINADWLRLQPLSMWFVERSDLLWIGPLLSEPWVVAIAAYGVILLHIVGAPLLLWRRTRPWVFSIYLIFHTLNHFLFRIGIFPWLTLYATVIFFEPDWPRRLQVAIVRKMWKPIGVKSSAAETQAAAVREGSETVSSTAISVQQRVIVGIFVVWLTIQILAPVRHLLYPGNVSWTEEGHRFAWQMKLRSKEAEAIFTVKAPRANETWQVAPTIYLTQKQLRKMSCRPDMILQFAHHLADVWNKENGVSHVEVRANVSCSLNGRRRVLLIDPDRDLAKIQRSLAHTDWILPLREPL